MRNRTNLNYFVYGGAFDPVHNGHVEIIHYLSQLEACDRLCLVPTGTPVFKDSLRFSADQRLTMLRSLFQFYSNIIISDYEVKKKETSFMVDTIRFLMTKFSMTSCSLVIGYDQLLAFSSWQKFNDILKICKLEVIPRQGLLNQGVVPDVPSSLADFRHRINIHYMMPMDVSSTQIRRLLDQKQPIDLLVPDKILSIIKSFEVN